MTLRSKRKLLGDTLAFGLKSDKVRKDATSKGNSLTFQQVYDLAKTEESTKAQMQAITQGDQAGSVHSVRRKQKPDTRQSWTDHTAPVQTMRKDDSQCQVPPADKHKFKFKFKFNGCSRCGNKHSTTGTCSAMPAKCQYCGKTGHVQRVHEETIKTSQRNCAKPRLQRPGHLPAGKRRRRHRLLWRQRRGLWTNYCSPRYHYIWEHSGRC